MRATICLALTTYLGLVRLCQVHSMLRKCRPLVFIAHIIHREVLEPIFQTSLVPKPMLLESYIKYVVCDQRQCSRLNIVSGIHEVISQVNTG